MREQEDKKRNVADSKRNVADSKRTVADKRKTPTEERQKMPGWQPLSRDFHRLLLLRALHRALHKMPLQ